MNTKLGALVAVALMAALTGCQSAVDNSANAEKEVLAADMAWAEAFASKDISAYLAFVEPTASIQQPNGPTVTGTEEIRALIEGFYALPNLSGTWKPVDAKASRSGDLAYTTGTYELSYSDSTGATMTDRGKYLEVWRKQSDGSWKMIAESFNSDEPPPGSQ